MRIGQYWFCVCLVTATHIVPIWLAGAQDAHRSWDGDLKVNDENENRNNERQDERMQHEAEDGGESGQHEQSKRTGEKVKNQTVLGSLTSLLYEQRRRSRIKMTLYP